MAKPKINKKNNSFHKAQNMSKPLNAPKERVDGEFLFIFIICMVAIYLYFISKVVAVATYLIFYPIVAPAYVLGNGSIVMFGLVLCVIWAIRFFVFNTRKSEHPRRFLLIIMGLTLMVGGMLGLTDDPVALCVPDTEKPTWDFFVHCKYDLRTAMNSATIGFAISKTFFYNFLFVVPALYKGVYYLITTFFTSSNDPLAVLRKQLSFDDLMKIQSDEFLWLKYYHKLKLSEKSYSNSGNFNRMQTVKAFLFDNNLISRFVQKGDTENPNQVQNASNGVLGSQETTETQIQDENYIPLINQQDFDTIMLRQLGDVFTGFEHMDDLELFLASIVIPRACTVSIDFNAEDVIKVEKEMYDFLDDMWTPCTKAINEDGEIVLDILDDKFRERCLRMIEPFKENKLTKRLIKKHAYNRTLLYSALLHARRLGVLAPSDFSWFKGYDRTMWAMVQNVGRGDNYTGAGYIEAIAIDTQYRAEYISNRRVYRPQLENAYNSTKEHLERWNFNGEFKQAWELWYTQGDASGIANLKENARL